MFSGIIEEKAQVKSIRLSSGQYPNATLELVLSKPNHFNDLSIGDSIAVNGVCLTVEAFDDQKMQFSIGPETIKITGWSVEKLKACELNLERSLRFGDRIHGHLVSGHVDSRVQLHKKTDLGDALSLEFVVPNNLSHYFVKKGSWTINGVSLTINSITQKDISGSLKYVVESCLIPETLRKTNLGQLNVADVALVEVDYFMRAFMHLMQDQQNILIENLKNQNLSLQQHKGAAQGDSN